MMSKTCVECGYIARDADEAIQHTVAYQHKLWRGDGGAFTIIEPEPVIEASGSFIGTPSDEELAEQQEIEDSLLRVELEAWEEENRLLLTMMDDRILMQAQIDALKSIIGVDDESFRLATMAHVKAVLDEIADAGAQHPAAGFGDPETDEDPSDTPHGPTG